MPGTARQHAASIIEQLKLSPLKNSFCCYGTHERVLIGIGRASSLKLKDGSNFDAVWASIHQFIENHHGDYIFGFIGFDPANMLNSPLENYQQKVDLFVPETVIECSSTTCQVLKAATKIEQSINTLNTFNLSEIDIRLIDRSELRAQYAKRVSHFIDAIHTGVIERATLARKVISERPLDLAGTFLADHSQHDVARSFYFSSPQIAFAGQSPELLAEGNSEQFTTHKLSGTYEKDNAASVTELSARFKNDRRIIAEHQSSIKSIEHSLTQIGTVTVTRFKVMELPSLLHGWSEFITQTKPDTNVAACLRSIFPFGVNPVKPGFELLAKYEDFCRGPYYGLTGCIQPDGEFSFTQVLRSAFADKNGSYLMVGAAITQNSTPELEAEETRSKLMGIKVYERLAN